MTSSEINSTSWAENMTPNVGEIVVGVPAVVTHTLMMTSLDSTLPNETSSSEVISDDDEWFQNGLTYFMGGLLVLIILMSISGNILVCVAVFSDRHLRKIGNLFIVSLAVADLLVSSLVMSFAVVNDLMGYWYFGAQFCDTWIAFDVLCCTASILNLCAISFDRFMHIKDPLRYGRWMTKRAVLSTVATIWMLSALVSFLPISLGWHRPKKTSDEPVEESSNSLPECSLDLTPLYAVVSSSISFYLPCIVMVGLYSRLFFYARKHVKNIRAMTKPVLGTLTPDCTGGGGTNSARSSHSLTQQGHQSHVSDHKAAITLGIIMGVFLVCWVPFFCINIWAAFCKSCVPGVVFQILTWLGYLNSALNPVIYSIFNTEFRDAFRRILTSCFKKHCCDFSEVLRGCRGSIGTPSGTKIQLSHGGGSDLICKLELNNSVHSPKPSDV